MAARRTNGEPGSSQPSAIVSSPRPEGELLAVLDAVHAVLLVKPPEAHELGDGLVHALARRADHPGQLFLCDRELELVAFASELEQTLGRAARNVEEHRVGQRLVDGAQ